MDHSQHSIHTNDSPHSGHDHHAMMHGTEATMTATVYPYEQPDTHSQHHGMDHRHEMTTMEHMMSMAFHFGCNETILFSWWKTETVLGLIGSMAVIFIMAVLYEGLKYYREFLFWKTYNLLEYRPVSGPQRNPEDPQRSMPSSSASPVHPTMMSVNHLIQTVLHIIQVTLSFLLMLIFMTYNVWLCIAVVLGAAVGYFLFCWKKSVIVDVTEHCH